jgi:hypothetical protein
MGGTNGRIPGARPGRELALDARGVWIAEAAAGGALARAVAAAGTGSTARVERCGFRTDAGEGGGAEARDVDGTDDAEPNGGAEAARTAIEVSIAVRLGGDLQAVAEQVRLVLREAAEARLGLPVGRIDVLVNGVLEDEEWGDEEEPDPQSGAGPAQGPDAASDGGSDAEPDSDPESEPDSADPHGSLATAVAKAARGVPEVLRLQPGLAEYVLSAFGDRVPGVRISQDEIRVQVVVRGPGRAADAGRAVREAVAEAVAEATTETAAATADGDTGIRVVIADIG